MTIKSKIKDYSISFSENFDFWKQISSINPKQVIVDENVWTLYKEKWGSFLNEEELYILPISEENKCFSGVMDIYDHLIKNSAKKNLTLVSIGGGITQDITGFVASTLYRGLPWIYIPTTILSQADSCLGAKTSLNYKAYKNLLGTFYPPDKIYIEPSFAKTLLRDDYYSGLGEVIKLILMDSSFSLEAISEIIRRLHEKDAAELKKAIHQSLEIKWSYIFDDEFDTGKRNLLNYGHCFGHALEASSHYKIPHGIGVTLGMALSNYIAVQRGLLNSKTADYVFENILRPNICIPLESHYFELKPLCDALKMDKKRVGEGFPLIVLKDDRCLEKLTDMTEHEVQSSLDYFYGKLC